MALLIILAIIGGLTVLSGLYLIGVEIAAVITAWTVTFKNRVADIVEKRKAKKAKKQAVVEENVEETVEGNSIDESAKDDDEFTQKDIINESMIEEVK